jgi:hypothetical protein
MFLGVGMWFEWLFTRPKVWLTRSGSLRFGVELLSAVIVLGTLWTLLRDFEAREDEREDRKQERINRAWSLISASKEKETGNIGLVDALETLHRYELHDLTRLKLPGAYLREVKLPRVKLEEADFQDADLVRATLTDAFLWGADLRRANLTEANLTDAYLGGAKLSGAYLRSANLEWAELTDADLSFADLEGVENLDTAELGGADYIFSDGLEGTFLDINQPPPDVLPASCDPCSLSVLSPPVER